MQLRGLGDYSDNLTNKNCVTSAVPKGKHLEDRAKPGVIYGKGLFRTAEKGGYSEVERKQCAVFILNKYIKDTETRTFKICSNLISFFANF